MKYCIMTVRGARFAFLRMLGLQRICHHSHFEGSVYTLLERYPDCAGKGHGTTRMIYWMKRLLS